MLDPSVINDLEELTLCNYCKRKYNDTEQCPKYLSCKHYFCLKCIENNLLKGRELFCAHCWKKTDLGNEGPDALPTNSPLLALANNFSYFKISTTTNNINNNNNNCKNNLNINNNDAERKKSENCLTHGMPFTLWCIPCCVLLCRACATTQDHSGHQIKSQLDAKEQLISDVQLELITIGKLSSEIQRLAIQQREFLIKVLEACITLKTHVETDLQNGWTQFPEMLDITETLGKAKVNLQINNSLDQVFNLHSHLMIEKQKLQSKYYEMILQCQLDDLIGNSGIVFDFQLLKQALDNIHTNINTGEPRFNGLINHLSSSSSSSQNPILFLANYCMSQLYSRHVASKQQHQQQFQYFPNGLGSADYQIPNIHPNTVNIHPITLLSTQQIQLQHHQHHQSQQHQPSVLNQVPIQTQIPITPGSPTVNSISPSSNVTTTTTTATITTSTTISTNSNANTNTSVTTSTITSTSSSLSSSSSSSSSSSLSLSSSSPAQTIISPSSINQSQQNVTFVSDKVIGPTLRNPSNIYPMYYFNIEVNNSMYGRIIIETRPDVAPQMAENFSFLATGKTGVSYKGCSIFQCWEGESIITGDYEHNNGRGGRSIYEDGYFMPDDTKFPAVRGAVGMRRTQKRHDNLGMVGSQFRIILQEMRGFTGIFGHVVEGLELVEKISTYGDQTGKPTKNIIITKCGKL